MLEHGNDSALTARLPGKVKGCVDVSLFQKRQPLLGKDPYTVATGSTDHHN
jgi:hypothetical protein